MNIEPRVLSSDNTLLLLISPTPDIAHYNMFDLYHRPSTHRKYCRKHSRFTLRITRYMRTHRPLVLVEGISFAVSQSRLLLCHLQSP